MCFGLNQFGTLNFLYWSLIGLNFGCLVILLGTYLSLGHIQSQVGASSPCRSVLNPKNHHHGCREDSTQPQPSVK